MLLSAPDGTLVEERAGMPNHASCEIRLGRSSRTERVHGPRETSAYGVPASARRLAIAASATIPLSVSASLTAPARPAIRARIRVFDRFRGEPKQPNRLGAPNEGTQMPDEALERPVPGPPKLDLPRELLWLLDAPLF